MPLEFNLPVSIFEEKYDEGWALTKPPKHTEFKEEQIEYLKSIFDEGQRTGKKERPENVAMQMRKVKKTRWFPYVS